MKLTQPVDNSSNSVKDANVRLDVWFNYYYFSFFFFSRGGCASLEILSTILLTAMCCPYNTLYVEIRVDGCSNDFFFTFPSIFMYDETLGALMFLQVVGKVSMCIC